MYNLSKQQQSMAIIKGKLSFQVFDQLAKTQTNSCSQNLPWPFHIPQKALSFTLKTHQQHKKIKMELDFVILIVFKFFICSPIIKVNASSLYNPFPCDCFLILLSQRHCSILFFFLILKRRLFSYALKQNITKLNVFASKKRFPYIHSNSL